MPTKTEIKEMERRLQALHRDYKTDVKRLEKQVEDTKVRYMGGVEFTKQQAYNEQTEKDQIYSRQIEQLENKVVELQGSLAVERGRLQEYKRDCERSQRDTRQLISYVDRLSSNS